MNCAANNQNEAAGKSGIYLDSNNSAAGVVLASDGAGNDEDFNIRASQIRIAGDEFERKNSFVWQLGTVKLKCNECKQPFRIVKGVPKSGRGKLVYIQKDFSELVKDVDYAYCDCPPPRGCTTTRGTTTRGHRWIFDGEKFVDAKNCKDRKGKEAERKRIKVPNQLELVPPKSERLRFYYCQESDGEEWYEHLHNDIRVMKYVTTGERRSKEWSMGRAAMWKKKWQNGNPFTPFTVRARDENKTFLGIAQLNEANEIEPNSAEISGLLRFDSQGDKLGREALGKLMEYAHELFDRHTKLPSSQVDFKCVIATVHWENEPSIRMLKNRGFTEVDNFTGRSKSEIVEEYGSDRKLFKFVFTEDKYRY